jgi:hypothetical protein
MSQSYVSYTIAIRQCVLCLPTMSTWYYQSVKIVEHFAILTNSLMTFTFMFVRTKFTTTITSTTTTTNEV